MCCCCCRWGMRACHNGAGSRPASFVGIMGSIFGRRKHRLAAYYLTLLPSSPIAVDVK